MDNNKVFNPKGNLDSESSSSESHSLKSSNSSSDRQSLAILNNQYSLNIYSLSDLRSIENLELATFKFSLPKPIEKNWNMSSWHKDHSQKDIWKAFNSYWMDSDEINVNYENNENFQYEKNINKMIKKIGIILLFKLPQESSSLKRSNFPLANHRWRWARSAKSHEQDRLQSIKLKKEFIQTPCYSSTKLYVLLMHMSPSRTSFWWPEAILSFLGRLIEVNHLRNPM